jgi:L-ascorbate metabolism protein UlaG (beta-lactamase superfamily)
MSIKIKLLGHASFQINIDGKVIYIDPYRGEYSEKADIILVSHSHGDHCSVDKIKSALGKDTVVFAPEDCAEKIGGKVKTLKPGQEETVDDIKVKAVEAYNVKRFRSPGIPFHPKGLGVGYLLTAHGKTVYHAGDTDFIPEMKQLGHIDVALLPSGDTYTMNSSEAADAALAIRPRVAIPMHVKDSQPAEFKRKVEDGSSIKVAILETGEEYEVT